jgi:hypothetical protein
MIMLSLPRWRHENLSGSFLVLFMNRLQAKRLPAHEAVKGDRRGCACATIARGNLRPADKVGLPKLALRRRTACCSASILIMICSLLNTSHDEQSRGSAHSLMRSRRAQPEMDDRDEHTGAQVPPITRNPMLATLKNGWPLTSPISTLRLPARDDACSCRKVGRNPGRPGKIVESA